MSGEGEGAKKETGPRAPRVSYHRDMTGRWRSVPLPGQVPRETVRIPAPEVMAVDFDVEHPSVPKTIKSAHSLATRNGWRVRLTYAKGPKRKVDPVRYVQTPTLALRCAKPGGRRVVLAWDFDGKKWSADGAYDAPFHPCTHAQAKEALRAR